MLSSAKEKKNAVVSRSFKWLGPVCFFVLVAASPCFPVPDKADSLRDRLRSVSGIEKARTLLRLSGCYINSDGHLALDYSRQALQTATSLDDKEMISLCLLQAGLVYNYLGQYDTAIVILHQAYNNRDWVPEPSDLGRLFTALGIASENAGQSDSALKYYQKAFGIYKSAENHQGIVNSYLNLGCLFMRQKNYDQSALYLQRSLDEALNNKATASLSSIYNNLGVVYDVKHQQAKALEFYAKAVVIQQTEGNKRGMANTYHNMGIIYNDLKKFDMALEYQRKSLALKLETGDREGTANSYSLMVDILFNLNRDAEAESLARKALRMAEEGGYLIVSVQSNKQLASVLYRQHRYKEAADFRYQAMVLNDSLYNRSVSEQIAEMQSKYEVKQKEQENQILRQEISLQQAREVEQQTRFRFLLFIVMASVAVLILLFVLLRMKVSAMRKTRQLYAQEYRLKELELAAAANENRRLEAEKQREETEKQLLLQQYQNEKEISKLETENLNARIELKNKELTSLSAHFISKNEILGQIRKGLLGLRRYFREGAPDALHELISLINSNLDQDLNWKKFRISFDETHPGFFDRLNNKAPDLTLNEQKLCAYLFIRLSSKEIAQVMNVSLAAVNKNRQRLRKRLGLEPEADICAFLDVPG